MFHRLVLNNRIVEFSSKKLVIKFALSVKKKYNKLVKQRIIFFGSGEYTIPIIEVLREYDLRLVVTTETEGPFIKYLKENKIPFLSSHVKDQKDLDQLKKSLTV
jgi:homospermidine synthase